MNYNKTSSVTAQNHFLIFGVTLTALIVICMLTLNNFLQMREVNTSTLHETQVIFNKPVPSGLVAAASVDNAPAFEQTSLPGIHQAASEIDTKKSFQVFWLLGIFSVIGAAITIMLRNLREDHEMKAISELHALARVEH